MSRTAVPVRIVRRAWAVGGQEQWQRAESTAAPWRAAARGGPAMGPVRATTAVAAIALSAACGDDPGGDEGGPARAIRSASIGLVAAHPTARPGLDAMAISGVGAIGGDLGAIRGSARAGWSGMLGPATVMMGDVPSHPETGFRERWLTAPRFESRAPFGLSEEIRRPSVHRSPRNPGGPERPLSAVPC
jgi:hypothetical protein